MKNDVSLFLIVIIAALLWGGEYLRRDLWEPDEGRYALVTREMVDSGDWLVMHRQGEHYSHKPPLFFWITGLVSSVFSGGEVGRLAPRIPSFLGAIMTLWAVSQLALRWFSRRASWLTVLLLSTSYLFWNKGGFGQIDALLCGLEMMALYFLFTAAEGRKTLRLICAYVFMGLGILAKGPVGFLVPLGIYFTASFYHPESKKLSKWHYAWGPIITLLFPVAWLLAAWMNGAPSEYLHELLFAQNVGRASGEFGGHTQPFYYFLKYFPLDFLPWSILLPLSAAALFRSPEYRKAGMRLVLWMVFVVVFFSLSASKRNLYILGAYPAAAMFVAAGTDHWQNISLRWLRNTYRPLLGIIILLGVAAIGVAFVPVLPLNFISVVPGSLALLLGGFLSYRAWKTDPRNVRWLITMATGVLIAFGSIGVLVYPAFNEMKTPREMVEPARRLLAPNERIIMYNHNGEMFSLYSGRMGYMASSDEELIDFLLHSGQQKHMIIFGKKRYDHIVKLINSTNTPVAFEMGNKDMYWLVVDSPVDIRQ